MKADPQGFTQLTARPPGLMQSLSGRLLIWTGLLVMIAQVLIYAPSASGWRRSYLEQKIAAAHVAVLTVEAVPGQSIPNSLEQSLLDHTDTYRIALSKMGDGTSMIGGFYVPAPDVTVDLRRRDTLGSIAEVYDVLRQDKNRVVRVLGMSPKEPDTLVDIIIDETPLRDGLIAYSRQILGESLVISLAAGALVFLTLRWLMVRPMRRLTQAMIRFREDPENAARLIVPAHRSDEIGVAERELAVMQRQVRDALHQKTRLAALGIAVTKINHDLRNILSSVRLLSDLLVQSGDPDVRRVVPALTRAVDRAVNLCGNILNFTREGAPQLDISAVDPVILLQELQDSLIRQRASLTTDIADCVMLSGDHDQLQRAFENLFKNALDAGATALNVRFARRDDMIEIDVGDNGPGLPPRAQEKIFQPFAGSAKAGGTGLGLAIAREIMRAHGGEITLLESGAAGTTFRLLLPDRPPPATTSGAEVSQDRNADLASRADAA